jgi:hypothetical protein
VNLRVRVNDELSLDAGATEEAGDSELVIHPPRITLFHQVLDYLHSKHDPPAPSAGLATANEGAAAASIVLRWGSYFAVLADSSKPVWRESRSPGTSRICDLEMARINIEASAALAAWIDMSNENRDLYEKVLRRALAYLPLPRMKSRPAGSEFAILAMPSVAEKIVEATDAARVAHVRVEAERHPSRIFANALVNTAWRHGPVEKHPFDESRGVSPRWGLVSARSAQPGGMRFDGVEFLRADTHRGWGIASMARAAARWARFS